MAFWAFALHIPMEKYQFDTLHNTLLDKQDLAGKKDNVLINSLDMLLIKREGRGHQHLARDAILPDHLIYMTM